MNRRIKTLISSCLSKFDLALIRQSRLKALDENARDSINFEMLLAIPELDRTQIVKYLRKSKSQLGQDLFVLSQTKFKQKGYFVEFGATNGVDLSNTFLLEKELGWEGILAEPAKCWHKDLAKNRTANLETRCVWQKSGATLVFNEVSDSELSTIDQFSDKDSHKKNRRKGKKYSVDTISLNDLLDKYDAPKEIDYLSIDTEGSEYDILKHFDFSRYSFKVITCEHNYSPTRDKLQQLLEGNGYKRVYEEFSKFDDWYIK